MQRRREEKRVDGVTHRDVGAQQVRVKEQAW